MEEPVCYFLWTYFAVSCQPEVAVVKHSQHSLHYERRQDCKVSVAKPLLECFIPMLFVAFPFREYVIDSLTCKGVIFAEENRPFGPVIGNVPSQCSRE